MCQSEEDAGAERGPEEEEEGRGGGGEGGEEGGREQVAVGTPNGPVYCICRRPDINCFMM